MTELAAKFPRVEIPNIDKLKMTVGRGLTVGRGSVKVSFEVVAASPDILKLICIAATAQPINVIFESPQAVLDLKMIEVNIKTGETGNA